MDPRRVSIIPIGSELLSGDVVDTNSSLIIKTLRDQGFSTSRICIVDDEIPAIEQEIRAEVERASLIITTGGLGPTSDDLTREAVAQAADEPLELNEDSFSRLEEWVKRRGRQLNENNKRQAYFPRGSEIVENRAGTADAFITLIKGSGGTVPVISLPGVPRELEMLLSEKVMPWLEKQYGPLYSFSTLYLNCFGLSESYVGSVVEKCSLPDGVVVAYRPHFPELTLTLKPAADHLTDADMPEKLRRAAGIVIRAVGEEFVFSQDGVRTLAHAVAMLFKEKGLTLAFAESCSGGLLADQIISIPGASDFFLASLVTYSNTAKEVFLGVKGSIIEQFGAVSREVAIEMARGAKYRLGADLALSITGIAGPDGGSKEKPVGTVWIGLVTAEKEEAFRYHLPWDRSAVRKYSCALALDLARREVLGYPLIWERR